MRNCINIIKYNLKSHKVLYIVELAVLLTCLISGIGSKKIITFSLLNGSSIGSMAVWGVLLSVVSYSSWLIVLLMIIVTAASYIEKNGLRVLAVVGFETIGLSIYSLLIAQITNIIPKINLVIQTGNKINLVEVIINLIVIVGLGYFSARSIDEKLSIY